MYVAVGSENPVKVAATERALDELADRVEPVAVDPGVSEQPRGTAETVSGAENRARRALDGGEYDLGVGIEGGVAGRAGGDRLYLIMWAAVTDGERIGRGGGPSIPLPEPVADEVRAGRELGPAVDDLLGREGVKRQEGAAGVFTGGHATRRSALRETAAVALGPFVTDHY